MTKKQSGTKFKRSPIVYGMLVLIAVGVSVAVIVAVINSSKELYYDHEDRLDICHFSEIEFFDANEKSGNGNDLLGNIFKGSGHWCVPVCVWAPSAFGDATINIDEVYFYRLVVFEYELGYPNMYLFKTHNSFFNPVPGGDPIQIGEANTVDGFFFEDDKIKGIKVSKLAQKCVGFEQDIRII